MKNFEEMFNNLIKTIEEKEQAMEQQILEAKQLESEIEEMSESLVYLDAMRAQLLEEKKQKENKLKQLNKSLGKIDTAKIEVKEPEQPKAKAEVEAEENVPEIPQLIENKPIKRKVRRNIR